MKTNTLPVISKKKTLSNMAEQAVIDMLPVDQKTLQRAVKILEPKNLKLIVLATVGGTALISVLTTIGRDSVYKAAVAHEMKKQLEPLKKKLNELEAQNTVLYQQNKELSEMIKSLKQN